MRPRLRTPTSPTGLGTRKGERNWGFQDGHPGVGPPAHGPWDLSEPHLQKGVTGPVVKEVGRAGSSEPDSRQAVGVAAILLILVILLLYDVMPLSRSSEPVCKCLLSLRCQRGPVCSEALDVPTDTPQTPHRHGPRWAAPSGGEGGRGRRPGGLGPTRRDGASDSSAWPGAICPPTEGLEFYENGTGTSTRSVVLVGVGNTAQQTQMRMATASGFSREAEPAGSP